MRDAWAEVAASGMRGKAPLVGLDVGTKRVGIAVSDVLWSIASPRTLWSPQGKDLRGLVDLLHPEQPCALVVGLPLHMDGSEGNQAAATRAFVATLTAHLPLPVLWWDERLSSAAVERAMVAEADLSRRKRKGKLDAAAAAYILQGALDRLALMARSHSA